MPNVYVIDANHNRDYVTMFLVNNWTHVNDPEEADLIQFTGGEDVSPIFYGEIPHAATFSNIRRDEEEAKVFNEWRGKKAMAGICRGGQFLNVMNGGRMWQDVDRHAVWGGHDALDLETNTLYDVSSTHHQMMDPSTANSHIILAVAGLSTVKENGEGEVFVQDTKDDRRDVEAVYFPETNSLSFQPHPEFFDPEHDCQRLYFKYIKDHLKLGA